jgi:hypothetical protein
MAYQASHEPMKGNIDFRMDRLAANQDDHEARLAAIEAKCSATESRLTLSSAQSKTLTRWLMAASSVATILTGLEIFRMAVGK